MPKTQTVRTVTAGGYQAEVRRFLDAIDPTAKDWLFLTYDDYKGSEPKNTKLTTVKRGNIEEDRWLRQILKEKNDAGAGVYVKLNETPGEACKAEDVTMVRAVMLDLDGSPLEPVLECPLPPHAIIATSPGRFHCYWRVTKDFPLDQYAPIQRGLAKRFNGDPDVAKLSVLARLPGFKHMKDIDDPHLVKLHTVNDLPAYTYEQVAQEFPPEEKPHKPPVSLVGAIVLATGTPVHSAGEFIKHCFTKDEAICLTYYQGCFYK